MSIEDHIQSLGDQLFESARKYSEEASWIDKLVTLTTRDESFRVQALRFIDVLPSLEDDISLTRHLQSYFGPLKLPLTRFTIRGLSRKFMGGQTTAAA